MSTENIETESQNPSQETENTHEQTSAGQDPQTMEKAQNTEGNETSKESEGARQSEAKTEPPELDNPLAVKSEKTEEEKQEDSAKQEEASSEGAPENYEDFKAPEGVELNEVVIDSFKGIAKKLNLSQAKAQQVVDEITPVMVAQQVESIKRVSSQWLEASKKDAEIGGSNYEGSIQRALMVRDRFGRTGNGEYDPDIADFFNLPIGSHPGFIKLLARIGGAVGEDKPPQGGIPRQITPQDIYG